MLSDPRSYAVLRIEQRKLTWDVARDLIRQAYDRHNTHVHEAVRKSGKDRFHAFIYANVPVCRVNNYASFWRLGYCSNKFEVAINRENVRECFVKREHGDNGLVEELA